MTEKPVQLGVEGETVTEWGLQHKPSGTVYAHTVTTIRGDAEAHALQCGQDFRVVRRTVTRSPWVEED